MAIVGTFAVMAALGYSLNNLSLFGLVLAIGIVVDDAIVVVENVERWLDQGVAPREAARKAMDEVTGPVIAVALVLFAVFVPCAFLGGISGQFFRQFAVTIAVSTVISAFNSLTLSPALAAILLRPRGARRDPLTWLLDVLLGWFFRLFNVVFGAGTALYVRLVGRLLRVSLVRCWSTAACSVLTYWQFSRAPTGFIPQQDKGYLLLNVQLPDSASVERTQQVMAQIETARPRYAGGGAYGGHLRPVADPGRQRAEPRLDVRHARTTLPSAAAPALTADAIAAALRERCQREVPGGHRLGLRRAADRRAGHDRRIQDDRRGPRQSRPGRSCSASAIRSSPAATTRRTAGPVQQLPGQHALAVPRHRPHQVHGPGRAGQRRLQHAASLSRLVLRQQLQRVRPDLAGEHPGRSAIPRPVSRHRQLQVRNNQGQMIRLGTLMDVRDTSGPVMVMRYNMYSAAAITGNTTPGTSSGQAIALMQEIAEQELPRVDGLRLDRTDLPATPGGQHGDLRLRAGAWCSCFWCWRRSTKAGRCRWP